MLEKQKELLHYVHTIRELLEATDNEDKELYPREKLLAWEDDIRQRELLIPVVGGFSAGKSTLINAFLGEEYLPIGITPETSLAAELHYVPSASQERLELLGKDGQAQNFAKDQFGEVKKLATKSRLVRVYLNNENLRKIEPLILVDMPGFESPLDAHTEAIFSYIAKGVHYVVLIGVEDGTISKSMVRQLTDIQNVDGTSNFQRDFSFFLSKANLRPDADVQKVKQYLENQLEAQLDLEKSVVPLGEDGAAAFEKILDTMDPNTLFSQIYGSTLKEVYYDITGNIKGTSKNFDSSIKYKS